MTTCACLGALQPAPIRTVVHGARRCVSTPHDGGEPTVINDLERCPHCARVRELVTAHGGRLCSGCRFADA